MTTEQTCTICQEESASLYQCCPTKDDRLCEPCWVKTIDAVAKKGKIGLLFTGKLPCDFCNELIDRARLSEAVQKHLEPILSTIPKTKTPTLIEDFNYSFNDKEELRHRITNERFIFVSQRHYSLLGSCLDTYIQSLMKGERWKYEEVWLPLKDEPTDDHHDQVNIFQSIDFASNENGCLILIQGSGVVRPGQWARSCCINDSLDIGAMFPYMAKAKEHNLSVIVLNPNQTSYVDERPTDNENDATNKEEQTENEDLLEFYLSTDPLPRSNTRKIPNLSTNREHVLYVYDNVIQSSAAKSFYIVAHSAGGDGLMYLLRKREDQILPTLSKIAFTDSVHSVLPFESNEIKTFLKNHAIHFVASDEPMGAEIHQGYDFSYRPACQELSAGHPKHEYTSGHCVKGVFDFFFPSDITTIKL